MISHLSYFVLLAFSTLSLVQGMPAQDLGEEKAVTVTFTVPDSTETSCVAGVATVPAVTTTVSVTVPVITSTVTITVGTDGVPVTTDLPTILPTVAPTTTIPGDQTTADPDQTTDSGAQETGSATDDGVASSTTDGSAADPSSTAIPASQCGVGNLQCCSSVQSSSTDGVSSLLGLLGVVLGGANVPIGLTCSSINVIGVSGNNCAAQPVCCSNNNFNGVVALGCVPVNLSL